ncbi:MAG: AmmeMemoRadiSam system protein B [Thiolinea sp.]
MANLQSVRQPQHHGVFYPADPVLLNRQLDDCFNYANYDSGCSERIKAIVVPHAGFDYSAHVAAQAYASLRQQDWIQRVVILAPNHQTSVTGGLVSSHKNWVTPLGEVATDQDFLDKNWSGLQHIVCDDAVHQAEYSIEVQLPFLQRILPGIPIVPLLLGDCTPEQIDEILRPAWESADTLIIISSDLYHYLPRESALPTGMAIAQAIENNEVTSITPQTACGYTALRGLMQFAARSQHYWRTLAVQHSGQDNRFAAAGLVGYGAFLLIEPSACRVSG